MGNTASVRSLRYMALRHRYAPLGLSQLCSDMHFRDNEINGKKTKGMLHFHLIVSHQYAARRFHPSRPQPPVGSEPSMSPTVRMQEE